MSEVIKIGYCGIGGFVVILITFVLGVTGAALAFVGGIVTAFSWLTFAFPDMLVEYNIMILGTGRVTEPVCFFLC